MQIYTYIWFELHMKYMHVFQTLIHKDSLFYPFISMYFKYISFKVWKYGQQFLE